MLLRKVNKAMLIEDPTKDNVCIVYMENARVSVDITDEEAQRLMTMPKKLFGAYIGYVVNEAEHELFLKELEQEEEKCK